ncbi:MAG: PBP1A family penicillin-binding protein [Campylobacteraceae bacterium]|jgi:penicillin-binding protein 1A|nr:PBP1A family penicillin-binding protein [Campylobacteraceae bacterium]
MRRFFKIIFLIVVVLAIFLFIYAIKKYDEMRFEMYKLVDYYPKLTTQIFDKNGKLIANYFDEENRLYTDFDDIPARMIEALVAIEDTAFFEHSGVNFEANIRATMKNIVALGYKEGASTLTQQLVKNVILTREKTLKRKLNEVFLSLYIEKKLTKEQIIERYLNHVYFGHGYYGIKTAADGYFHKTLPMLTLKEMAMLVGIPRSPSNYDPTKNYNLSLGRANSVLFRMKQLGWITESEYEESRNEEPVVFNDTLTKNRAPYVVDEVIKQASKMFEDVRSGGYQIYTTIDLDVQDLAQESLVYGYNEMLKRVENKTDITLLNGAMVVSNNRNGEVLALVGGIDYVKSNFNRATSSNRQTGSSFKPFIYQIALNLGYSTVSLIPDISRVYVENSGAVWAPKNIEGSFQGLITLKESITKSRNLATINLINEIGLDVVHEELVKMGFKGLANDLSIALGSYGISPLKYSKFFGMFANGGEVIEPILIKKMVNRFGNEEAFETTKYRLLEPEQSYLMVDMLKNVVEAGTGRAARVAGIEIAGKTGTTNDNVDAWFCGFNPDINVIVWYGKDDNTPMPRSETGGATSVVPFAYFMKKYIEMYPQTTRKFAIPEGVKRGAHEGKEEFFTKRSPLPNAANSYRVNEKDLLF